MVAMIAKNIASRLSELDPANAAVYAKNAEEYSGRMLKLAEDYSTSVKTLESRRIVTQHGILDYLARDAGLEIIAVVQAHPGHDPAAAEMIAIIRKIRETKAGAVLVEPQYPAKIAGVLAKETGISIVSFDPVAGGPENAGLDYYEKTMRANLQVLIKTIGGKNGIK
jgi:ABC-type Zn uptake system ZnuABC Zn-binding protein ZnuA